MSQRLVFPDPDAAADLLTFAGRAAQLGPGSAVRLHAAAGTLVVTTAVLAPKNLLDETPTVLAMRMLPVDPELQCDLAVDASALAPALGDASAVSLPASAVSLAWAAVSPPRTGWSAAGELTAAVIASRAQWGIAAVADAVPTDAGEEVVRAARAAVWGPADEALHGLPLGVAFAAFALGFIAGDETAAVRRARVWSRVTLARGHVLTRGPVGRGLTPVRRTGA